MSETKHSPAPWTVTKQLYFGVHAYSITGADGHEIGIVMDEGPVDIKNAETISAAPELLAELKKSVLLIRAWHGMGERNKELEAATWETYWKRAPELRSIRELLEKFL